MYEWACGGQEKASVWRTLEWAWGGQEKGKRFANADSSRIFVRRADRWEVGWRLMQLVHQKTFGARGSTTELQVDTIAWTA